MRVVELLRARLLELELPATAQGEEGAEPPAAPLAPSGSRAVPRDAPAARERSGLHAAASSLLFDVGLGASSSIGAVRVTPLLAAGAMWRLTPTVEFVLSGLVPLGKAEVSRRGGSASVETWQLTAGSRIHLLAEGSVRPIVGAGLGLVWFRVEGTDAATAYALSSEQLLVPSAHVELGVHWKLSRKFALSSGLCPSLALAKPLVEFADRQVFTLGRPLVAWTLRVEYRALSDSSRD